MKNWYVLLIILMSFTMNAHSAALSQSQIRATGKGMLSTAGFYGQCGEKNIIKLNRKAHNFYFLIGTKYLIISGIFKNAQRWHENGKKGIIIRGNEKPEKLSFSKEACSRVKTLIEYQYNLFLNTINI